MCCVCVSYYFLTFVDHLSVGKNLTRKEEKVCVVSVCLPGHVQHVVLTFARENVFMNPF